MPRPVDVLHEEALREDQRRDSTGMNAQRARENAQFLIDGLNVNVTSAAAATSSLTVAMESIRDAHEQDVMRHVALEMPRGTFAQFPPDTTFAPRESPRWTDSSLRTVSQTRDASWSEALADNRRLRALERIESLFEAINIVKLEPQDVLVLKTERALSADMIVALQNGARAAFNHPHVVVLAEGMELEVVMRG